MSIDSSLQSIGAYGFAGCEGVESISCKTATPPSCPANTFDGIDYAVPVTVPMASVNAYRSATGWNNFINYDGKN
ncbi:MAG: hypothetical protein IJ202_14235 [Bacteroidales bacterium]|nr:hypothetical protein [Bacteroidales bacterium]